MLSNLVNKLQYLVEKNGNKKFFIVLIFLPAIVLRLYHMLSYSASYGYDAVWHLAYIRHLAAAWSIPSAYADLESYQPPLYYFISAFFVWIIGAQNRGIEIFLKFLNVFYSFLMLWFIYKTLSLITLNFLKNNKLVFLCAAALSFYLPAHLYLSPMVSNEMLCACLGTAGLYIFTYAIINKKLYSIKTACWLGFVLGLALLTKYTAILFFITFIIVSAVIFLQNKIIRQKFSIFFAVVISVALLISGWWYVRNMVVYGNFLIKANDMEHFSNVYLQQPPGYHSAKDFFIFDFNVFLQPFLALDGDTEQFWSKYNKNHFLLYYNPVFSSVLTGTFSTLWVENHGMFLKTERLCLLLSRILLATGFFICILSIAGFIKIFIGIFQSDKYTAFLPVVVLSLISIAAYISYNIRYPYFCHVKAFLMLHLTCPFIVSFAYGLNLLFEKYRIIFDFVVLLLFFMIILVTVIYGFFLR